MNAKLLLVDDEPAVLKCLRTALTRLGYAVTAAASGEEAVALLARETFDLVVTDFRMPGLSGAAVAEAARERLGEVPVLLITGWVDEVPEWLRSGADALRVIAKPFTLDQLAAEVRTALAREAAVPA